MNPVTVRQAVFADLDVLAHLFDAYRASQGAAGDAAASRAFLQARFNHGESVVFLAHDDASALGFAQLYPSYSSTALARVFVLNDLFVAEAGRRRGVASALLAALEAYAWSHGAARVTLNVARDNVQGQALYEAQGWSRDTQFFMYHRFPDGHRPITAGEPAAAPSLPAMLALERGVWEALVRGDPAADAACLHESFLGVYASGLANRQQHAAQLAAGPIVASYEIHDARLMVLQPDLMMLVYRADFTRPAAPGQHECMYVSSLWRRFPAGWRNVFSQDTHAA